MSGWRKHVTAVVVAFTALVVGDVALASGAGAGVPRVGVFPAVMHPQGEVVVRARGFASKAVVDVRLDGRLLTSVVAGTDGRVVVEARVPGRVQPGVHRLTAGVAGSMTGSSSLVVRTDWEQAGRLANRKSSNPFENTLDPGNAGELGLNWSAPLPGTGRGVAVVGDTAYVTVNNWTHDHGDSGYLLAIDVATGAERWRTARADGPAGYAEGSAPLVLDDARVVAVGGTGMVVYDRSDGRLLEDQSDFDGPGVWPPAATAQGVYAAGGGLFAFERDTLARRWGVRAAAGHLIAGPAVAEGRVYGVQDDGRVLALDEMDGHVVWERQLPTASFVPPTFAAGLLYVGGTGRALYALDATTGELRWTAALPSSVFTGVATQPVVADGVVVVQTNDAPRPNTFAFRIHTGAPVWSTTVTSGNRGGIPAAANGVFYTGNDLTALDLDTGTILFAVDGGARTITGPAVVNGHVYAPGIDALSDFALPA